MIDVIIITLLIYRYQLLPRPETRPIDPGDPSTITLPNLTGSCARDANQLGAFGLEVRPPARGIDIHSTEHSIVDTEHSTEDTAGDEYSTVEHSRTQ